MVVFVIDQQVNLNIFTPVCLPPPSVKTSTLLAGKKVNISTSISSLAPTRWFIKWKKDFIVVVRNSRFLLKQVLLRTRQQSLGLGQLSGQRTTTTNQFFLTHFRWATSEKPLDFFRSGSWWSVDSGLKRRMRQLGWETNRTWQKLFLWVVSL